MIRILSFIIILALSINAQSSTSTDFADFVNQLDEVNNLIQQHVEDQKQSGVTENGNDENLELLIQQKKDLLSQFASDLRVGSIDKFDTQMNLSNTELYGLKVRIKANKARKYHLSQRRDEAILALYDLNNNVSNLFTQLILIRENESFETDFTQIVTEKFSQFKSYTFDLPQRPKNESKVYDTLLSNYEKLEVRVSTYTDIFEYLSENAKEVSHRSILITATGLNSIVANINNHAKENDYYYQYKFFDTGKLLFGFILHIIAFTLSNTFLRISIYFLDHYVVKDRISEDYDRSKDVKRRLVRAVQKPVFWTMNFLALDASLGLIYYPNSPDSWATTILALLYMSTGGYAAWNFLDKYEDIFTVDLALEKLKLRKEVIAHSFESLKFLVIIGTFVLTVYFIFPDVWYWVVGSAGAFAVFGALVLKDTFPSIFSSVVLVATGRYKLDDWVKWGLKPSEQGTISSIGWRYIVIWTFSNTHVTIPVSTFAQMTIENFSNRIRGRHIKLDFHIPINSPREDIEKTIKLIRGYLHDNEHIAKPYNKPKTTQIVSQESLDGDKDTLLVYLEPPTDFSFPIQVYCFSESVDWEEWTVRRQDTILDVREIIENNGMILTSPKFGSAVIIHEND